MSVREIYFELLDGYDAKDMEFQIALIFVENLFYGE